MDHLMSLNKSWNNDIPCIWPVANIRKENGQQWMVLPVVS